MTDFESLLERVCSRPDDLKSRAVLADLLQEQGDPWGELMLKKRGVATAPKLAARIGGPLAKIASVKSFVVEHGFVTGLTTLQSAPKAAWENAARDARWALVKEVRFDWGTPRWFVTRLAANPAFMHVEKLSFGRGALTTLRMARDEQGWRVTADRRTSDNFRFLRAFDAGLPAEERARLRKNSGKSFER